MKFLMITLLASSALFAQAPDAERPAFPPALEKFLGLAAGQADAIVDANEQFRDDPLRQERVESLKQKRHALSEELNSESPDPGLVGTLTVDIEMLDRELRAMREAFQQEMLTGILGVSPDDEEPADVLKRLNMLERAKKIVPLYNMAVRYSLVDSPRQMRQSRKEAPDAPSAE
jgi:hypothetical protein